jgi:hypothetical protein
MGATSLAASSFLTCSVVRFQPTAARFCFRLLLVAGPYNNIGHGWALQQPVERHLRYRFTYFFGYFIKGIYYIVQAFKNR